jgi:hypothetical protein
VNEISLCLLVGIHDRAMLRCVVIWVVFFQAKEEKQSSNCLENYGFDYGGTEPAFHGTRDGAPEVKCESREHCMSMLQISDSIETSLRILYPILFFIFNLVYWLTFRKLN